ncbi:MAG: hypothetical protein K1000chlam2_01589 [Chlamydiae bacterium]|nr:hypothetical protein [Chlamydiota bacterium]
MKTSFLALFLLISFGANAALQDSTKGCCSSCVIDGKVSPESHKYKAFLKALELIKERKLEVLVETGTSRVDKKKGIVKRCSSLVIADWVRRHGGKLDSLDIKDGVIYRATNEVGDHIQFVKLDNEHSIEFLKQFDQQIDFLYLDSEEISGVTSEHHLKEITAAYPWLTQRSVVMVDNGESPQGGKGKEAVGFLLDRGWRILSKEQQVMLSQEIN